LKFILLEYKFLMILTDIIKIIILKCDIQLEGILKKFTRII